MLIVRRVLSVMVCSRLRLSTSMISTMIVSKPTVIAVLHAVATITILTWPS